MVDTRGGKVTPAIIPENLTYSYQTNYGRGSPGGYTPGIITGNPSDWFGPLNPQAPSAPPEVSGRRFDFPSGYNLNLEPRSYKPIKFADLRALAETYDVLRTVIETRKDQMVRLQWNIKPREDAHGKKMAKPNDPILNEIREFFEMPDGHNFWDAWLRMLLEDLFVLDAPAVYCRRNRGGKLIALDNIDGATLKVIIDNWGRIPEPPIPGYQQTLHGLPALNYTKDDIIYRPRNMRSNQVYGYGPVEQIIMTVNIALRRQIFMLQYYTEGNVPEALIGAPDNWTPEQIAKFQEWFDSILAGETGSRRRARFIPGGAAKNYIDTKSGALTDTTDEWLTRVICFAFSITPTPFMRQVNRATAESQKEQAQEEGLAPIQLWVQSYINYIIRKEWKRSDIHFAWEIPEDVDAEKQSNILVNYVKTGVFSINMALDKLGEDPIENGDQHLALLPTGWVPIAPTNQFGAAGGAAGVGEVDDQLKARGNVRDNGSTPKVITPPPEPTTGERGKAPEPKDPKTGVGKSASTPFTKGSDGVLIDANRPAMVEGRAAIQKAIEPIFGKVSNTVRMQVETALKQIGKGSFFDIPLAQRIADAVDLSGLGAIAGAISGSMADIAQSTVDFIIGSYGLLTDSISDIIGTARDKAEDRADELVSLSRDGFGVVSEDSGADMSIVPTTRKMILETIENGIKEQLTADEIAGIVESTVFSPSRIEMIANAEASFASAIGTEVATGYIASLGIGSNKAWVTQGDNKVCADICAQNELDGAIGMNEAFSSGDQLTPGHPRCRCSILLVHS